MQVTFKEILQYCFDEASQPLQSKIDEAIIFDEPTADLISGINRLKLKLGSKSEVEKYFEETIGRSRKRLFPID